MGPSVIPVVAPIAAPAVAVRTCDAHVVARICTPEAGCHLVNLAVHLSIDTDGAWVAAYHDPLDPMRGTQAEGACGCESAAIARMLDAMLSLREDGE